jgi:nucleoside-diphosphate-sugar epimerase/uncharacterized membrane protein
VTGSSGLIGSRVCAAFAKSFRVVGLDRDEPKARSGESWIACDLTDEASVRRALDTVKTREGSTIASVIHLAAYYDFSGEPSPLYRELTVEGTRRLLRALRGFRVEQFVFSSSLLVMKSVEPGETLVETSPVEATWDYPRSKLEAEAVVREERGEIPAVILRIAGVYDEDGHSIPLAQQMSRIYERSLESHLFPGNAEHGQSFVHLDDVVSCVRAVVERRRSLGSWELFLIGEPDVVSYEETQDILGQAIHGTDWTTIRIPAPVAKTGAWLKDKLPGADPFIKPWMIDLADTHLPVSIQRAHQLLDWAPRKRLRAVLPEMARRLVADPAAWYERNGLEAPAKVVRAAAERAREPGRAAAARERGAARAELDLDAPAPPWGYNPSAWRHRVPICVVAGVAMLIASYMALYQWRLIAGVWDPFFGEQSKRVLDSDVSERMRAWVGVPDAALGALAYLGDLVFGLAGSTRRWQDRPWMVVLFGLDVIPLGIVSAVLVVLQGTVVGYWCFLCLVTASLSLVLVVMSYDEVWSCLLYLKRVWQRSRSVHVLWDAFWGRPSDAAREAAFPAPRGARA